ncbi:deoxyribose-phosphate aldolase [Paenibacillus eucommiae]|uniref:Deoxyribose-phosphate aldolase n=1 Tax=Paenibacillus eucommiae TaxID=1355755 RepID=A0ABS4IX18_9BACL|nr:deoxyribose-phosphate aldolase [Paenibacillus eucommiae]MBP1992135.1 deoxyribose-phosphate aldolase [Paenibacillus eucommiae]
MTNRISAQEVASKIQHTLVAPDATEEDIKQTCRECLEYGFDGAMILPAWISTAKQQLKGSKVKVCTAFGFPMGGSSTLSKVMEARDIVAAGADEIDFMPNFGLFKSGRHAEFKREIEAIVEAAGGIVTKVMLEFGMLLQEEKEIAATLALEAGVTYLKNSSGWGQGGHATAEDIRLLKRVAGNKALVKASGGIRNMEKALEILEAGAVMLGTSGGVKIVSGLGEESTAY